MQVAPFRVTVLPGEASSARTPRPKDRAGTQTTPSGMSATTTGSVTLPRSPVTVTSCSPPGCASSMPSTDSYDARLTRATGLRAVARRCSSPSCIEPRSTSCFQVARAKAVSPFLGALTGFGGLPASSAGRAPSHGPRDCISSRTSATVRKPSGRP